MAFTSPHCPLKWCMYSRRILSVFQPAAGYAYIRKYSCGVYNTVYFSGKYSYDLKLSGSSGTAERYRLQ